MENRIKDTAFTGKKTRITLKGPKEKGAMGRQGCRRQRRMCKAEITSASRNGLDPVLNSKKERSVSPLFTPCKPNVSELKEASLL